MTDIPERIFVVLAVDNLRDGRMWWRNKTRDNEVAYIRADLVASKDAEIARLRGLLKARDRERHDFNCESVGSWIRPCTCGHDAVADYFRKIEG